MFSGIGGFSVGLEATGKFKTIGFCEQDKFCQKVLRKHWNDVPIYEDIKKLDARKIKADVLVGGFPCQSFSIAGKQKGKDDERYLWDEMFRVIKEVKPRWIIGENVQNLINIADGQILQGIHNDLESQDFEVQTFNISASSQGAWHKRARVWIIAADSKKLRFSGGSSEECRDKKWKFQQKKQKRCEVRSKVKRCNSLHNKSWWEQEHEALTKICRVPYGLSAELDTNRNDRIKALGNSICPPIITEIGKAIIKAEEENV